MSPQIYKIIHLTGVLMIFLSYGALIARSILGEEGKSLRKFAGLNAGIGLLLVLVGGFGLIAKLKYGFPGWIIAKLVIWLALGGLIAVANRKPQLSKPLWWVVLLLGVIAAALAGYQPS